MSATSETTPVAAAESGSAASIKRSSLLSKIRLLLAFAATFFLLYPWGYTLVFYSRWGEIHRWYLAILVGVLLFAIWTTIAAILIALRNGDVLPHWLVFAGFYPATLWVVWAAWMFFAPIRNSVRFGVLGLLVLAIFPFVYFFVASD